MDNAVDTSLAEFTFNFVLVLFLTLLYSQDHNVQPSSTDHFLFL